MMKTYVNKMKHGMLIASSPSPRPDDSDDDEATKSTTLSRATCHYTWVMIAR